MLGSVTRQKAVQPFAPRLRAACSKRTPLDCRLIITNRMMNGIVMTMWPRTIDQMDRVTPSSTSHCSRAMPMTIVGKSTGPRNMAFTAPRQRIRPLTSPSAADTPSASALRAVITAIRTLVVNASIQSDRLSTVLNQRKLRPSGGNLVSSESLNEDPITTTSGPSMSAETMIT